MTHTEWTKTSGMAAIFANLFFEEIEGMPSSWSIEKKSAHVSAAYNRAVQTRSITLFNGYVSNAVKDAAKAWGQNALEEFLLAGRFDTKSCIDIITKIRDYYVSIGAVNYNYGIAQKWVSLVMKYYIICKSCFIQDSLGQWKPFDFFFIPHSHKVKIDLQPTLDSSFENALSNYELFVVDAQIANAAKSTMGIAFHAKGWTFVTSMKTLTDFWSDVATGISSTDIDHPFCWELSTWHPTPKDIRRAASRGIYFS